MTRDLIDKVEAAKQANDIVSFLAGEIMNITSFTEETRDNHERLIAEREKINYYAVIMLDYMSKSDDDLISVITLAAAEKKGAQL